MIRQPMSVGRDCEIGRSGGGSTAAALMYIRFQPVCRRDKILTKRVHSLILLYSFPLFTVKENNYLLKRFIMNPAEKARISDQF